MADHDDLREEVTCPRGHALRGTLERLAGVCRVGRDGSWASSDSGTDVWWEEAQTVARDAAGNDRTNEPESSGALPVLVCAEACQFTDERITFDVLSEIR